MPAYEYPISIKREPQQVEYSVKHMIPSSVDFTLAYLEQFVDRNDTFLIYQDDDNDRTLEVFKSRLETLDEYWDRIEKEESYMREYNKRHPKEQEAKENE